MAMFSRAVAQKHREQEDRLRPFLRTRAARARDVSGLKASAREIAAALWVCQGHMAEAQRLLVRAIGVSLGPSYVSSRTRASPELTTFLRRLRLENRTRRIGGRLVCPGCGALYSKPHN